MASERMVGAVLGQKDLKLLPDGLDEVWWQRGHGRTPLSGSVENSPDDGKLVPAFQATSIPIDGSSKA